MHTHNVDAGMTCPPNHREPSEPPVELRQGALCALLNMEPDAKCAAATTLWTQAQHENAELDVAADLRLTNLDALNISPGTALMLPGRPAQPRLVDPAQVPQRSVHTLEGRAALLHAICHIEFNAVNLALDAVWRFPKMPRAYYIDWLRVASEEASHFLMLRGLRRPLPSNVSGKGWDYGDFDAHDGLWAMCEKTSNDITARMALVPRTLEARGLDATPLIQAKLRKVNTPDALATVCALDIILRDEVGHVAIGNHWYRWLCDQQQLEPVSHYRTLARCHSAPRLKPPFNEEARRRAGFTSLELEYLHGH